MLIHLNIGTNQGDRRAAIARAAALIARAWPRAAVRLSRPVESAPWGYASTRPYLNAAAVVATAEHLHPLHVLRTLQAIERRVGGAANHHRRADGTYRDRRLDIDIIAIDRLRMATPALTLPHPRATQRPFVMAPLKQLHPPTYNWLVS